MPQIATRRQRMKPPSHISPENKPHYRPLPQHWVSVVAPPPTVGLYSSASDPRRIDLCKRRQCERQPLAVLEVPGSQQHWGGHRSRDRSGLSLRCLQKMMRRETTKISRIQEFNSNGNTMENAVSWKERETSSLIMVLIIVFE